MMLLKSKVFIFRRLIFTSSAKYVKRVERKTDGMTTTIEGVKYESERKPYLMNYDGLGDPRHKDPIIRLGLKIRHSVLKKLKIIKISGEIPISIQDVLILSQFIRPDGSILPQHVSRVSTTTHKHIELMIERARRAGLLPMKIHEDGTHEYYDGGFHKFNTYYDSDICGLPKLSKLAYRYVKPK